MTEAEVLENLKEAITTYNDDFAVEMSKEALKMGMNPLKAVDNGMVKGLDVVGDQYEREEIFLPELMMAARTFQSGMDILEPKILEMGEEREKKGVVVIGTVKGDIHKIGKDIVTLLFRTSGFEVHDLGEDVDLFNFIETAKKVNADAIGLSALLTSTLAGQKDVIDALEQNGLREKFIVMIGGGAVTSEWAESIGADLYAENAQVAIKKLTELLEQKK